MKKVRVCVATALSTLIVGCASYGPLGTTNFEPTLRRDVPSVEGRIEFQSPGAILFGVDGYKLSDQLRLRMEMSRAGPRDTYSENGVIVVAEHKLYFVKWTEKKYEDVWDLDYKKVQSLEVRSFGLGRMIVAKLDGDPPVVSYEAASDSGQSVDAQRTITVCQLMARNAGKECKLPQ